MANETITPAAGIASGAGIVDARTQRVVHCTDDPAVSGIGTTLDAVVGDNTTPAASATAASGISLWKRIVNLLIAIHNHFGVAGTANAGVLSVQGIASGTVLPISGAVTTSGTVTEASAAAIAADTNELTAAPVAKTWVTFTAVVAAGPAKAPLTAAQTFCRQFRVTAKRATTVNTNPVYVGVGTLDDVTDQQTDMAPGDMQVVSASPGCKIDLNLWFVDGLTAGDGVTGQYEPI